MLGRTIVFTGLLVGCAHRAEGPLDVPVGLPRAELARELRGYDYCPQPDSPDKPIPIDRQRETFPRCDNPGLDYRDSWVVVEYTGGRVSRVLRYERWDDDARASQRWDQLVTARTKTQPPSAAARAAITAHHDLPPGTRSWQAFQTGVTTATAIYLLTPRPPENASVLEEILGTDASPSTKP